MRLTENFSLHELTYSQTALKYGIDNQPDYDELQNLKALATNILQPVREHFGKSVHVSSGFRCTELNSIVSKSKVSQHMRGMAADFEIFGVDNREVARWIADNLVYDQLILEYYNPGEINSGWVHCSFYENHNRLQQLIVNTGSRQVVESI